MPQIKSLLCRQAYVVCWSDILVKNGEMLLYFLFEAFFQRVSRPVGTNKHPGFSQFGKSVFIVIAITAEQLQVQTKTTQQQPTFTFGNCEEISSVR